CNEVNRDDYNHPETAIYKIAHNVAPTQNRRSAFGGDDRVDILAFDGCINECKRGAAESFVLAEHEREVAANLRIRDGNRGQHVGPDILLHVRAGDEAHADVRSEEHTS